MILAVSGTGKLGRRVSVCEGENRPACCVPAQRLRSPTVDRSGGRVLELG
jgi:hypothetical protein